MLTEKEAKNIIFTAQMRAFPRAGVSEILSPMYEYIEQAEKLRLAAKICATCKWHSHEDINDGWICVNHDSEHCADWTNDEDKCKAWEGK